MARLTNRPGTRTLVALALGAGFAWLGIVRAEEPAWSPAAPMGQPRVVMTATPLLDGRVLVAGGVDAAATAALNTAEISRSGLQRMVDGRNVVAGAVPRRCGARGRPRACCRRGRRLEHVGDTTR